MPADPTAANVVTFTAADWGSGSVEVEAVHVCGVGVGDAAVCKPWGCACDATEAYWGACADSAVEAWYLATCGGAYTGQSVVGAYHPGCAGVPSEHAGATVAFRLHLNASLVDAAAAAPVKSLTPSDAQLGACNVIRAIAATGDDPAAHGGRAWYLCVSDGAVRVHAVHAGETASRAFHTADTPGIPVGKWAHVAVFAGAREERLYVNGALVFRADAAAPPVRWAPSARFFAAEDAVGVAGGGGRLLIDDLLVFRGEHYCRNVYTAIAHRGTAAVEVPVPCALSSGKGARLDGTAPAPLAYLKFNDAWTSQELLHTAGTPPGALRDEGGAAHRIAAGAPAAAVPGGHASLPSTALSVAFWLKVESAGTPRAVANAVPVVRCETFLCDTIDAGHVIETLSGTTESACKAACMGASDCGAATFYSTGDCTLGYNASGTPAMPAPVGTGATTYVKEDVDGDVSLVKSCMTPADCPSGGVEFTSAAACSPAPDAATAEACRLACAGNATCVAGHFNSENATCTTCTAHPGEYTYGAAGMRFVKDAPVAFDAMIFSTGSSGNARQLLVGTAEGKVLIGARSQASGSAALEAALWPDESPMQFSTWHHVVLVAANTTQLYVDGQPVASAALAALPADWASPASAWDETMQWLTVTDPAEGAASEVDVAVDNLAVYGSAMTAAEAASVYRDQVGWAGLAPDVWHDVAWSLTPRGEVWRVDGNITRECPVSATPIAGRGAMVVGKRAAGEGWYGDLSSMVLQAPAGDHGAPVLVAELNATEVDAAAPPGTFAFPTRPFAAVVDTLPTVAPAAPEPRASFFRCTGCSENCSDACHESYYTFNRPGGVVEDATENDRHAVADGVEFVDRGVGHTKSVQNGGGRGSVVFASLDVGAWREELAGAAQLSFFAWVRPASEAAGLVFSVVDRDGKTLAAALYTTAAGEVCGAALGTTCCTTAGRRLVGPDEGWQHVGFAAKFSRNETILDVHWRGETNASWQDTCQTERVVADGEEQPALPARPHAALFSSHEDVAERALNIAPLVGAVDGVKLASAARAPDYDRFGGIDGDFVRQSCATCSPCGHVDYTSIDTLYNANFDAVRMFARAPVTPYGHPAMVVVPARPELGNGSVTCGLDVKAGEEVQFGTMIYTGAVELLAEFVQPGCALRCDVYNQSATAVGCGEDVGNVLDAKLVAIDGGWWHCTARFVSAVDGRVRGGAVVPKQAVIPGFGYSTENRCGNGVVEYPAEVCDPRAVDTPVPCDRVLCTRAQGVPSVLSASVSLAFPERASATAEADAAFAVDVVFDAASAAPTRPRAFLSHFANCSDPDDHVIAVLDAHGRARIPTTDPAAAFIAPTPIHLCLAPTHEGFVSVANRVGTPCKMSCRGVGWCSIFAEGTCACIDGLSGEDCTDVASKCDALFAASAAEDEDDGGCDDSELLLRQRFTCSPSTCEDNGGTCAGQGVCVCPIGFAPPECNRCLPGYAGDTCQPACGRTCDHGACHFIAGYGEHCVCDAGWKGSRCDVSLTFFQHGSHAEVGVSSDGRELTVANETVEHVVLAFPQVSASGMTLEFAVEASAGVRVGVCSSAASHESRVGADQFSWGVELGDLAIALHDAVSRPLGISTSSVALQLDAATATLTVTTLNPRAEHGVQLFSQVCPGRDCYGCASVERNGFVRLV
eukprot:TRINITY_DN6524_c3_g2_i1.p1 TRINITY_DN6524_c3_g2~~TRINITY_DN6524_c3_g2_i1.p1  ORF type:complete len:1768 (+),score=488.95 TRINITY_DN6524_c3_g2_i1:307-5304(+)